MKLRPCGCRRPAAALRRGGALVMALAALLVVTLVAGALVKSLIAAHRQSRRYAAQSQAQWLAEAGLARARAQLAARPDYAGETWQAPMGSAETEFGLVTIRVEPEGAGKPRLLVVEAVYPPSEHQGVLVRREQSLVAAPAE